jgi:hypothetical protein
MYHGELLRYASTVCWSAASRGTDARYRMAWLNSGGPPKGFCVAAPPRFLEKYTNRKGPSCISRRVNKKS